MSSGVRVSSKVIKSCTLYQQSKVFARLDTTPFVILYAVAVNILLFPEQVFSDEWIGEPVVVNNQSTANTTEASETGLNYVRPRDIPGLAALFTVLVLHALTFLVCYWSVILRARIRFREVNALSKATHVLVIPAPHSGSSAICPLHHTGNGALYFEFQQIKFVGDNNEKEVAFQDLDFPMNLPLLEYFMSNGMDNDEKLKAATAKWGANEFDIPLPKLDELFIEQALAPFFVFQVFCVLLWCLDEYWYYSLFTLAMLVVFELTVCMQRKKDLEILRAMRKPPYPIYVYRKGSWTQVLTNELVPGDICSLVKGESLSASPKAGEQKSQSAKRLVPCDVLLISGSCVVNEAMLTGESVPNSKSSLADYLHSATDQREVLVVSEGHASSATVHDKQVILGGTSIVQQLPGVVPKTLVGSVAVEEASRPPPPPDGGSVGFVLRTGYYTSQGSLMRTILFSTERVTVDNNETYLFILVLVVFAIAAAAYVLVKGLEDEARSRWKLMLHCIMIVTSVVPPELPMELSMAVTTSLVRLKNMSVFCTEPYRIPFAGKLDVCCFDKTGTLTSDNLIVKGVAQQLPQKPVASVQDLELCGASSISSSAKLVLGACHELVRLDGSPQGDPMEKAALKAVDWTIHPDGTLGPAPSLGGATGKLPVAALASAILSAQGGSRTRVRQLAVHPFSSALRRMSCIVRYMPTGESRNAQTMVLCKGAPEVLEKLLKSVPKAFRESYQELMRSGFRVLALATKTLDTSKVDIEKLSRADVESELDFAGLLVLECPMKEDTKDSIDQLLESGHRVVIITGDNALTACNVANELNIVQTTQEKTMLLRLSDHQNKATRDLIWVPLSEHEADSMNSDSHIPYSTELFKSRENNPFDISFVVTGEVVSAMEEALSEEQFGSWMRELCPSVSVFARVAPRHKEIIVASLKAAGLATMMCGDGTNDVGALKQADVGVSIINNPDVERSMKKARKRIKALEKRRGDSAPPLTLVQKAQLELQAMEEMSGGSTMLNLGDASIASPFTSQSPTIRCTVDIVKQGRCTLVTTIQMFKILALNCMVTAYSLSALHLYGVKQGDTQMTLAGLLIAGLFMAISMAEPLEKLSNVRPTSRIFSPQVGMSLLGQLFTHMSSLFYVIHLSNPFIDGEAEEMKPDADFKPNVINTAVFIVSLCMQVNVFACNYRGRPYMISLVENKPLRTVLVGVWLLSLLLASEIIPDLGELFELVPLPDHQFRFSLLSCLLCNTVAVWSWELGVRKMIPG